MIVFELSCREGHRFEGWFGSSQDFASQKERGLLCCPQCGSPDVTKAPMAPAVSRKGNQQQAVNTVKHHHEQPVPPRAVSNATMPAEVQEALAKLAEAQSRALANSKWVGQDFAENARAMHYGERDAEAIHGETSLEEAERLIDEGINVAPLPFPVAPPKDLN
jgi:hypothetical protein